jgi:hypothetical protein
VSKRINSIALFLAFALLLCEVNFTVADTSYRYVSDALSANSEVQDQSLSKIADTSFDDLGTPELISGRSNGSLFGVRSQTKGREFQRLGVRLLLLFVSIICFLLIAFRHLRFRLFLPKDAVASSVILFFIHSKDGKK